MQVLNDGQYKASKFLRYSLASSQSSNSGANPACKSVVYKPHMLPLLPLILLRSLQNREVAFLKDLYLPSIRGCIRVELEIVETKKSGIELRILLFQYPPVKVNSATDCGTRHVENDPIGLACVAIPSIMPCSSGCLYFCF